MIFGEWGAKIMMPVGAGFKPALSRHRPVARDYPGRPPSAQDCSQCNRECGGADQGRWAFEVGPATLQDILQPGCWSEKAGFATRVLDLCAISWPAFAAPGRV